MQQWLLPAQAWWDAQRFDQPAWQVAEWRDQKVRHIQLHVAKALGKVVAALDAEAAASTALLARVRDEVLPDVAIYRSQLRHMFPDCGALPASRHRGGFAVAAQAASAPHAAVLLQVALLLSRASGMLAAYIEPREHGLASPASHIAEATQDLHASAAALAAHFAVDLTQAHQARLEALLGAPLPASLRTRESTNGQEA